MNDAILLLGWLGAFAPMALGAIGSIIGCTLGGQAALGALTDTDAGHSKFIGVSVMPSSQTIYGIVVMFSLQPYLTPEASSGVFAIGVLTGLALLASASYQGRLCASAIYTMKVKPEVFGISLAPAAIVEGFSVFAFIFALVLSGSLPGN